MEIVTARSLSRFSYNIVLGVGMLFVLLSCIVIIITRKKETYPRSQSSPVLKLELRNVVLPVSQKRFFVFREFTFWVVYHPLTRNARPYTSTT